MIHHFGHSRGRWAAAAASFLKRLYFLWGLGGAITNLLENSILFNVTSISARKSLFMDFPASLAIITRTLSVCAEFKVWNYFLLQKVDKKQSLELSAECLIISPNDNVACTMCYLLPSKSVINCKGYFLRVSELFRCDSIKETQFLKWSINMVDMNDEGSEIKQNGHTLPKTLTFAVWKEKKGSLLWKTGKELWKS